MGHETGHETLLDRDHLDAQTFGDAALAQDLLDLFDGQCRRLLPQIGDARCEPDARADLAHTLRGSALGIGATRLAARADEAEQALRAASPRADARIRALTEAAQATLGAIGGQA